MGVNEKMVWTLPSWMEWKHSVSRTPGMLYLEVYTGEYTGPQFLCLNFKHPQNFPLKWCKPVLKLTSWLMAVNWDVHWELGSGVMVASSPHAQTRCNTYGFHRWLWALWQLESAIPKGSSVIVWSLQISFQMNKNVWKQATLFFCQSQVT